MSILMAMHNKCGIIIFFYILILVISAEVSKKQDKNLLADRRYCGYQHTDDYIRENDDIKIDEFPWLAVIEVVKNNNEVASVCGGSLINDRYILTAAHCLDKPTDAIFRVRLGDYHARNASDCVTTIDLTECSKAETFGVEMIISHAGYNKETSFNDIGLLRLRKKVQYSDYIRPICLPTPEEVAAQPGEELRMTGFGLTKFSDFETVDIKKKILSKLITHEECVKEYKGYKKNITHNHICTIDLDSNKDYSCRGDGGAPVMYSYRNQWQQEGMISFGRDCGSGKADVHVKISKYVDWIKKFLSVSLLTVAFTYV